MLKPHKFLNVELCVLNIAKDVILLLQDAQSIEYAELLSRLVQRHDKKVQEMIIPALNFLFLVGKITYHRDNDSIELLQ
jgi:hypothetical protein